ncbi:MAG: protoheme IX farnesyltransferase [SAR202 cluster bacterium]|nr:protoheme IX farnesyltransferase [Chloroflexota bacterium]MDP6421788.1 heme o synthase [SAR202 cluster bacterium]HAL47541.1 protoheme IX farnesyltransferase [Dehalococcoidia bacterium]MDP6664602.1 heme o synthase [SAR202 cluster bacterium]MDP6800912.1 heme o synthase [SAR202 cluster bacterium]
MATDILTSRSVVRDYIALAKPRIVVLLAFTALGGMFLASGGAPDPMLTLVVLVGGSMAAGGANALNHILDRDIDERMARTRNRPMVRGAVGVGAAVWFGIALNAIAFAMLTVFANSLSAVLTLSATLFYVFVYTKSLKRTTTQNIVIGGAAGAIPPVVAWAAVTGGIGMPAVVMFAIVFLWTPPHFWALALLLKDDYADAGVPMLPVVAGVEATKVSILRYSWVLVASTLLLPATGAAGLVYLVGAAILGLVFVYYAHRLMRLPDLQGAKAAYLYSLAYLGLLFLLIIVDSVAPGL